MEYIYISQIEDYARIRRQLMAQGYKEGLDFSGAFTHTQSQTGTGEKAGAKGGWTAHRELFDIWKRRVNQMTAYIDAADKSVLDVGCGAGYLKELLAGREITYMGCDCVKREAASWICDFNKYEFPDVSADVAFISGCLEYVWPAEWFLQKLMQSAQKIIMSYVPLEYIPDISRRRKLGFCNDYSICQIKNQMEAGGFVLKDSSYSVTRDLILLFKREANCEYSL